MGVIFAKFRKEKSTQAVLEALQEKIDVLETFTVDTQEKKKRILGNFLAVSIGIYVIAFALFYFAYLPSTWKDRIVYFVPLLLFPIIIILLRRLFTWYFQRKINKNSKQLTALRAEKKQILEQVMDRETYKVAVNLLARFADKPSKPSIALTSATPAKNNQQLSLTLPTTRNQTQFSKQLSLSPTPSLTITSNLLKTPKLNSQVPSSNSPAISVLGQNYRNNQELRRRTPFPIVNQQQKGVFDRIVDILIGDGPQDRFAMICKKCYSHNGMALRDDFEYTTFICAFCNAINSARKSRPVAPRLSVLTPPDIATASSDTSDSEDYNHELLNETTVDSSPAKLSTLTNMSDISTDIGHESTGDIISLPAPSSNPDVEEKSKEKIESEVDEETNDNLLEPLIKSDSAIEDTSVSPQ